MAKVQQVAETLLHLASNGEEPDPLTHLRLQKLLYYVQGWSLALRDQPIFEDRIEAWTHGPVVPAIYHDLKKFGTETIARENLTADDEDVLLPDEFEFISEVWESYKDYSASKLREMTHNEEPWKTARGSCGAADRCNAEMSRELLKSSFAKMLQA